VPFPCVKYLVGARNRPVATGPLNQLNWVARRECALLQDAQVPTSAARVYNFFNQVTPAPPPGKLPTRLPRLGNLKQNITGAPCVANRNISLGQAADGEILAKCARLKLTDPQFLPPEVKMVGRVCQNRLVDPSMVLLVGLVVPLDVRTGHPHRPANWLLEKSGHPGLLLGIDCAVGPILPGMTHLD